MNELGIDISNHFPKIVDEYLDQEWDYIITVCDDARETCPVFLGEVKYNIHIGFKDPAQSKGTEEEVLNEFRAIRDQILRDFYTFYNRNIR